MGPKGVPVQRIQGKASRYIFGEFCEQLFRFFQGGIIQPDQLFTAVCTLGIGLLVDEKPPHCMVLAGNPEKEKEELPFSFPGRTQQIVVKNHRAYRLIQLLFRDIGEKAANNTRCLPRGVDMIRELF